MLYRRAGLVKLIAQLGPKIDLQARRLLAKQRLLPDIRVDDYIMAQPSRHVRASIAHLMAGRRWRYVPFSEFLVELRAVVKRLVDDVGGAPMCFVVDSLRKSSFWVVALTILVSDLAGRAVADDISLAVGNLIVEDDVLDARSGLRGDFASLPPHTRIVLMDDATYSGDQLATFYDFVSSEWRAAHPRRARAAAAEARPTVVVPFMSRPSLAIFRKLRCKLIHSSVFDALLHKRTLAYILSGDLFLERSVVGDATLKEYQSLYFGFLGVLPPNTLIMFEHKIADALSIPDRWLQVGPCVPPSVVRAFRVRPDRLSELEQLLAKDARVAEITRHGTLGTSTQRAIYAACTRVAQLMQSPRFRSRYLAPVALDGSGKSSHSNHSRSARKFVPFAPLIPLEFCDPPYQHYIQAQLSTREHISRTGSVRHSFKPPPCRQPPYRRSSFQTQINSPALLE